MNVCRSQQTKNLAHQDSSVTESNSLMQVPGIAQGQMTPAYPSSTVEEHGQTLARHPSGLPCSTPGASTQAVQSMAVEKTQQMNTKLKERRGGIGVV